MHTLGCILVLFAITTSSTSANNNKFPSIDVDALNNILQNLDSHLENYQKRSCRVGIMSHNCKLSELSKLMRSKAFLSSGYSPGKRSTNVGPAQGQDEGQNGQMVPEDILEEASALQENLMEQRNAISRLKHSLKELKSSTSKPEEIPYKPTRSCRFRLGGHCLTQALDKAASSYYYLRSPNSPGRRKRSTAGTNTGNDVRTQESIRVDSNGSETLRR